MKMLQGAKSQEDMLPSERLPSSPDGGPSSEQFDHMLDIMHGVIGKGKGVLLSSFLRM